MLTICFVGSEGTEVGYRLASEVSEEYRQGLEGRY
jgi:hypothetical protein